MLCSVMILYWGVNAIGSSTKGEPYCGRTYRCVFFAPPETEKARVCNARSQRAVDPFSFFCFPKTVGSSRPSLPDVDESSECL